jgi:hypothetical protein
MLSLLKTQREHWAAGVGGQVNLTVERGGETRNVT